MHKHLPTSIAQNNANRLNANSISLTLVQNLERCETRLSRYTRIASTLFKKSHIIFVCLVTFSQPSFWSFTSRSSRPLLPTSSMPSNTTCKSEYQKQFSCTQKHITNSQYATGTSNKRVKNICRSPQYHYHGSAIISSCFKLIRFLCHLSICMFYRLHRRPIFIIKKTRTHTTETEETSVHITQFTEH